MANNTNISKRRRTRVVVHEWTVSPEDFDAITSGKKKFEIRKQDRDFTVGDLLILREGQQGAGTGDRYYVRITYIG